MASTAAAYVWEDPGDSIMIQIGLDVVARLSTAVGQKSGAGPRETEMGGLLLGRILPGCGRTVLIEDFELVPSQHLRGASYTLSPKDRHTLGTRLARHRKNCRVVGYFRSHTRPGLYLDQDDFAVISSYFPDPSEVFLVVRPAADGPAVGGFFFWEEGDVNRRAPYRQFPFDREALLAGGFSITGLPAEETAGRHVPVAALPPAAKIHRQPPAIGWLTVPVVAGLFLIAGLFVSHNRASQRVSVPAKASAPSQALLSLNVSKRAGVLQVRWDPNLPAIRKADLGVLRISDGPRRLRQELDPHALAAGSTTYAPLSEDVDFELQVFALTDKTDKLVEGAEPIPPPAPPPVEEVARDIAPPVPAPAPAPMPRAVQPKPAPRPAPVTVAHVSPAVLEPPPPLAAPVERSQPKLAVLPVHVVNLPPPAPLAAPAKPHPSEAPHASAEVRYDTPHGSKFKRVLHKISTFGESQPRDGFVPPTPVHQVTPAVPPGAADADAAVDVKVYIDESGKVSRAELLTKAGNLAGPSLSAARQWNFAPARKHDKPVPSEVVLHFRFG